MCRWYIGFPKSGHIIYYIEAVAHKNHKNNYNNYVCLSNLKRALQKSNYITSKTISIFQNLCLIILLILKRVVWLSTSKQPNNHACAFKSMHCTGPQALCMYLECSHPKLNHDRETLLIALMHVTDNNINMTNKYSTYVA